MKRCLTIIALVLISFVARAEDHAGLQWVLPEPSIQMDMDPTLVPVNRGAVFVPCMSYPALEPAYSLINDDGLVGTAPVGTRIIAEPGEYRVLFGSGTGSDRVRRPIVIRDGKTTLVTPDWSGLRVQVVDETAVPVRAAYELVHLPSLKNLGIGHGARVEQGERIRTWVLEPGLYMILKVGESYQARRNFFTIRLRPGHLEQVTLVVNPETGDFLGGGEMSVHGAASKVHRDLLLSGVIGAGAELSHRKHVTGVPDETRLTPSFYMDFLAQFTPRKHYFYGRVNTEEAFTQEDWGRFEKNTDFLRLDSLYAYRLFSWFGPYARFGLESTIFPGYIYFDSSQTVTDTASGKDWSPRDELRVSDSFFPLTLKGGGGLRFSTPPATWINAWALLGAGGRFTYTGGLFRLADLSDTPNRIEVEPVGDFHSYGIEATVVLQMTLTRWVVIDTEFDGFAPFDDFQSPTIRWDNNLGLRITSYVSINYGYRLEYIPELNENLQHDHRVQVRFSYKFF